MKKVLVFMISILILTSFVVAKPITSYATEDKENNQISVQTQNEGERTQIRTRRLTQTQIQEIKKEAKRIRIQEGECLEGCDCSGVVMKCALEGDGREMTITAGNSGNTIIQVKGVDGSTQVTLYRSERRMYGEFNGITKEVRVMPDMVKDKIREKVAKELEDEEIELDENGIYQYRARRRVKIFGFIKARMKVRAEIDSETGELKKIRNPWWVFFTKEEGEPIVGASCKDISPGNENECCMKRGYDMWSEENSECMFSSE